MSRDTWAYDYNNPVELNRYVYTANNPVNYVDFSGYFFDYANINSHVGATTQFVMREFGWSILEGAVAGVVGYIAGTFLYHMFTDITYDEWLNGRRIKLSRVLSKTMDTIWQSGINLAFSAIFGGIIGGANYFIGTAIKSHWITRFGQNLSKKHIEVLAGTLFSAFVLEAISLSGIQTLFTMWAEGVGDPAYQPEEMANTLRDVVLGAALNGGSTIGMLTDLSPSMSIVLTTGFNAIATLSTEAT